MFVFNSTLDTETFPGQWAYHDIVILQTINDFLTNSWRLASPTACQTSLQLVYKYL